MCATNLADFISDVTEKKKNLEKYFNLAFKISVAKTRNTIFTDSREAAATNNFIQQVIRSTHVQWLAATHIASHIFSVACLLWFLFHCYQAYRKNNGAHVEMILRLDVSYLTNTIQASVGHSKSRKARPVTPQSHSFSEPARRKRMLWKGPIFRWSWLVI